MKPISMFLFLAVLSSIAAADPLPKAMARDGDPTEGLKKIPPFLGLFGSADFIAKLGFRSRPGAFAEYTNKSDSGQHMRIAEVGPAVPGARWIEVTATLPQVEGSQGVRLLTRGEKNGNIERFIAHVSGMPPMELPMEAVGGGNANGLANVTAQMNGLPRSVGHEKVDTAVGPFMTEHFVIDGPPDAPAGSRSELWVTKDDRVPFVGVVKMLTPKGVVVLSKIGTNAEAAIPVPQRGG